MRQPHPWLLTCSLALVLTAAGSVGAQEKPKTAETVTAAYGRDIRPLLAKYCFSCHGVKKAQAALNLEGLAAKDVLTRTAAWKHVWDRVHSHQMPPAGKPQPTFAERQRLVAWMEDVFCLYTLDGHPDPGPWTTRRLNVRETMHTFRDLAVTNAKPQPRKPSFTPLKDGRISLYRMLPPPDHPCDFVPRLLPQDTNNGGYDTIADNLSLPPALMEKYLRCTRVLLDDVYSLKGKDEHGRYQWTLRQEVDRLQKGPPPKGLTQRQALVKFLQDFATRAYRRPVTAQEMEKYARLFDLAQEKKEDFETSIRLPIQAILVSPGCLLLGPGPAAGAKGPVLPLNDHELAARLSYFLWSSVPDRELVQLADKGRLQDPAVLEAQVRRMMNDWRARDGLVHGFLCQWLQLDRLERANPDADRYASYFQNNLGELMTQELVLFADAIMGEDRSVMEFIDADWGFVCHPLAVHYGLENFPGKKQPPNTLATWYRVQFPDKSRGGVLTMGKVLTGTAQSLRTSPVARGKWLLETVLGTPPPPPPPDVDNVLAEEKDGKNLTVRQRLEKHRTNAACASCHRLIDPLGMALETYDPVGRRRELDQGQPIDPSGELVDGRKFKGVAELKAALLSRKDDFTRAFVRHMMEYALGRKLDFYDVKTVREITARVAGDGYRFSRVVVEVAKSYPFRYRRVNEQRGGQ
jgi:hypothetical protein